MNLEIRNKNVLIIGASKGIGREISLAFAKEGAMVTAIARNEKLLVSLQHEMKQIYEADHKYYVCDLMDMDLTVLANKLLIEKGPFDIIVHNVGGSLVSRNALGTLDEWEYAWKFNAGIAIALNNILIPPMIEKNGVVSFIFLQFRLRCYGVTRCMLRLKLLNAYVTTVGRTIASSGVVMSAVMPGAVAFPGSYWDEYTRTDPERCNDFLRHHQAAGRFGTTKEIADVVLFMASEQASFMQAAIIPVDGANM